MKKLSDLYEKLTAGQLNALSLVRSGCNVLITGGAGVGKSYIASLIIAELKAQGKTVLITAPTGRAAMLISGATCHRTFSIPLDMSWEATPQICKSSPVYAADAVVIDEVSMLRIDNAEFIFKAISNVNELRATGKVRNGKFKPIQVILVGDYHQLPPVLKPPHPGSPSERALMSAYYHFDVGQGYSFRAPSWKKFRFKTCMLTEVVRQSDRSDVDILNGIRIGQRNQLGVLREAICKEPDADPHIIRMCGTKKTAEDRNLRAVAALPGPSFTYESVIEGEVMESDKLAPDRLTIKVGARVMMLVNTLEYCNGSLGTVVDMDEDTVTVWLDEDGSIVEVCPFTWPVNKYVVVREGGVEEVRLEKIGSVTQFPIRLAYAITIHKSQGQTFDAAELVLGDDAREIFTFGQFYVAASRVRSLDKLSISGDPEKVKVLADDDVLRFYQELRSSA